MPTRVRAYYDNNILDTFSWDRLLQYTHHNLPFYLGPTVCGLWNMDIMLHAFASHILDVALAQF